VQVVAALHLESVLGAQVQVQVSPQGLALRQGQVLALVLL
jgi:hypothetical protein